MKGQIRFFINLIVIATMLFSACSGGDDVIDTKPPEPKPPIVEDTKIPISITPHAADNGDIHFERGDKVGLYVVNYNGSNAGQLTTSGNHVDNLRFSYSDSWTPDKTIYWKDENTKADFFCYYPYTSSITNVSSLTIAVKEDQSSEENYKASQFLWGMKTGVDPTKTSVDISLKHAMSKLIVKLVAGTGIKEEELTNAEVLICGLKTDATLNLTTGEITATGTTKDITPKKETAQYEALIIPQSIKNIDLIKVTIDNKTYLLNQTTDFVFNKQYTCTINIDRSSQGVTIGIGDWDIDDNDYGNTN